MKKNKWRKVLWISLTLILLLGLGGFLTLDKAVDYTLKQMAGDIELDEFTSELEGDIPNVSTGDTGETTTDEVADQSTEGTDSTRESEDSGIVGEGTNVPSTSPDNVEEDKEEQKDNVSTKNNDGNISREEAQEVQQNVTAGEKMTVASVLLKRFTMDELKQFMAIAKDGITTEEKKEARGIFLDRLTEEEYNELIAIAAKHGLSKGKAYDEVKKEE